MTNVILYRRGTSSSAGDWQIKTVTNDKYATPEIIDNMAESIHEDLCRYGCSEHCRGLTYFFVDKGLAQLLIKEQKKRAESNSIRAEREMKHIRHINTLKFHGPAGTKLSEKEMGMVGTAIGALLDGWEGTTAFTLKEMKDYRKLAKKLEEK